MPVVAIVLNSMSSNNTSNNKRPAEEAVATEITLVDGINRATGTSPKTPGVNLATDSEITVVTPPLAKRHRESGKQGAPGRPGRVKWTAAEHIGFLMALSLYNRVAAQTKTPPSSESFIRNSFTYALRERKSTQFVKDKLRSLKLTAPCEPKDILACAKAHGLIKYFKTNSNVDEVLEVAVEVFDPSKEDGWKKMKDAFAAFHSLSIDEMKQKWKDLLKRRSEASKAEAQVALSVTNGKISNFLAQEADGSDEA